LQPMVAAVLAIRAGLRDARTGCPAYGWAILTDPANRSQLLRDGWKEVAKVFVVAFLIDLIYEIIVYHTIYPVQSLTVAVVLALLPYCIMRGPLNRIACRWYGRSPGRAGVHPGRNIHL